MSLDVAELERIYALPAYEPPPAPPAPSFVPPPPTEGELAWARASLELRAWLNGNGVKVYADGTVMLFKCVGRDYRSAHGVEYPVGEWVETPHGLYVSAHQEDALAHVSRFGRRRMLWVRVAVDDLTPLFRFDGLALDKIRCRRLYVERELT